MTYQEAKEIIDHVSYKPDFRIMMYRELDRDSFAIKILRMVKDVKEPLRKIPIIYVESIHSLFFVAMKKEDLLKFLMQIIKKVEIHEVEEWFSYEGNHIFDPHQGEKSL